MNRDELLEQAARIYWNAGHAAYDWDLPAVADGPARERVREGVRALAAADLLADPEPLHDERVDPDAERTRQMEAGWGM